MDDQQGQIPGQVDEPFVEVVSKKTRAVSVKTSDLLGSSKSGPDSSFHPLQADSCKLTNEKLKGNVEEQRKPGLKIDKKKGASLTSTS